MEKTVGEKGVFEENLCRTVRCKVRKYERAKGSDGLLEY